VNKKPQTEPTEYRSFNLQLPVDMFDTAKRKAAEQGVSMQSFIRMGVSGITGVPDPTKPYRRRTATET
jgi:hypothetical protein